MANLKIPIRLDSYKPLREIVFEALREAIMSHQLEPGERLMEIQLAEAMGVSRTPVREAIRRLELEGFVVMIPRKGAYVAELSLKDINDVFEIRGVLEGLAASLAAERATDEEIEEMGRLLVKASECLEQGDLPAAVAVDVQFHEKLYEASRNQRLSQIINNLREQIFRYRTQSLSYPGRLRRAIEEHRLVVDAVADRDPEQARKLAEDHIESAEHSLMEAMQATKKAKSGADQPSQ